MVSCRWRHCRRSSGKVFSEVWIIGYVVTVLLLQQRVGLPPSPPELHGSHASQQASDMSLCANWVCATSDGSNLLYRRQSMEPGPNAGSAAAVNIGAATTNPVAAAGPAAVGPAAADAGLGLWVRMKGLPARVNVADIETFFGGLRLASQAPILFKRHADGRTTGAVRGGLPKLRTTTHCVPCRAGAYKQTMHIRLPEPFTPPPATYTSLSFMNHVEAFCVPFLQAYVRFASADEAQRAVARDCAIFSQRFGQRYVHVYAMEPSDAADLQAAALAAAEFEASLQVVLWQSVAAAGIISWTGTGHCCITAFATGWQIKE